MKKVYNILLSVLLCFSFSCKKNEKIVVMYQDTQGLIQKNYFEPIPILSGIEALFPAIAPVSIDAKTPFYEERMSLENALFFSDLYFELLKEVDHTSNGKWPYFYNEKEGYDFYVCGKIENRDEVKSLLVLMELQSNPQMKQYLLYNIKNEHLSSIIVVSHYAPESDKNYYSNIDFQRMIFYLSQPINPPIKNIPDFLKQHIFERNLESEEHKYTWEETNTYSFILSDYAKIHEVTSKNMNSFFSKKFR